MSKRKYRSVAVKQVCVEQLVESLPSREAVFAVDVAKTGMFAALVDSGGQLAKTVRWTHPGETGDCVRMLGFLRAAGVSLSVAMEPTGTYGDALRWTFGRSGYPVYRVSAKRCHDAAEVYDGVPSLHDAKSSAIIAKLFFDGACEVWPAKNEIRQGLRAELRIVELHEKQFSNNRNLLEALLARHWPELGEQLKLSSAALLELLSQYGGPAGVAANSSEARELMRRVGGCRLAVEKISAVVDSAQHTVGEPQLPEEERLLVHIAKEARRNQRIARESKARIEAKTGDQESTKNMAPVVGKKTAAVLVASLGDPSDYDCAQAYRKSLGLNLWEKSSGDTDDKRRKRGQISLHISRRGPAVSRMLLYYATLRLIQRDEVVAAWYARKVARDGGRAKLKAVVAIMRKLALALWHVSQGEPFDSAKLFDTRRLRLDERRAA